MNDLVRCVDDALWSRPSRCPTCDVTSDGQIAIDEIIAALNAIVEQRNCSGAPCRATVSGTPFDRAKLAAAPRVPSRRRRAGDVRPRHRYRPAGRHRHLRAARLSRRRRAVAAEGYDPTDRGMTRRRHRLPGQ